MKHLLLFSFFTSLLISNSFAFEIEERLKGIATRCFQSDQCSQSDALCRHPSIEEAQTDLMEQARPGLDRLGCSILSDIAYSFNVELKDTEICLITQAQAKFLCSYSW